MMELLLALLAGVCAGKCLAYYEMDPDTPISPLWAPQKAWYVYGAWFIVFAPLAGAAG